MSEFRDASCMKGHPDAAFERIRSVDADSLELQKEFARDLCILALSYMVNCYPIIK